MLYNCWIRLWSTCIRMLCMCVCMWSLPCLEMYCSVMNLSDYIDPRKSKKKHNFGSLKHELQLRVFWLDHLNSGLAFYVVYGCSNDWCAPRCCRFVSAQGVAIILNLDEKSPHANTVSWLLQEQGKVSVARIEKVPPVSSIMAWWKMDHRNQWFS